MCALMLDPLTLNRQWCMCLCMCNNVHVYACAYAYVYWYVQRSSAVAVLTVLYKGPPLLERSGRVLCPHISVRMLRPRRGSCRSRLPTLEPLVELARLVWPSGE